MRAPGSLRIVELVNTTEYGGVEEHVRELASGLLRMGDDVRVVCPPTAEADRFAGVAAGQGIDVVRHDLSSGGGLASTWETFGSLRRMFRAWRPDVLHVHLPGYTGGRLAVLAARSTRVGAIVCTAHLAPGSPVSGGVRLERAFLNRSVNRFVAVSADSLDRQVRYLGQPRSRSTVIHNGVDLDRFMREPNRETARRTLGLPPDIPVIGTVGRLTPQKSMETLIESLPMIHASRPDVHTLIVGDGPLRDRLWNLAEKLGVTRNLHMVGFRTDIPLCMDAMDVFVLPSLYEGLPISILEAMGSALPVVATNVDGVPEAVIEGVTGRLIPAGKPRRLAEAVVGLIADPDAARAMGAAGRDRVRRGFTVDGFVASTRSEYRRALARSEGAMGRRAGRETERSMPDGARSDGRARPLR